MKLTKVSVDEGNPLRKGDLLLTLLNRPSDLNLHPSNSFSIKNGLLFWEKT